MAGRGRRSSGPCREGFSLHGEHTVWYRGPVYSDGGSHAKGARNIGADLSLYEVNPVSMGRAEGKAEVIVKQTLVNREPCSAGDDTADWPESHVPLRGCSSGRFEYNSQTSLVSSSRELGVERDNYSVNQSSQNTSFLEHCKEMEPLRSSCSADILTVLSWLYCTPQLSAFITLLKFLMKLRMIIFEQFILGTTFLQNRALVVYLFVLIHFPFFFLLSLCLCVYVCVFCLIAEFSLVRNL